MGQAVQVEEEDAPLMEEKVSAGQGVQDVAPADEYDPGEHSVHAPLFQNLPAGHEQEEEP